MKPTETLFAAFVVAGIAGVGASLATRAFVDPPARAEGEARRVAEESVPPTAPSAELVHALDTLRMENAALTERVAQLEGRLGEGLTQRVPVAAPLSLESGTEDADAVVAATARVTGLEVTPDFVASVGQALETIKAKEEAERRAQRKEAQAQRIEERLTKLQAELGLSNRQTSDVRTLLLAQDDRREALMSSTMRDGGEDRRAVFEGFRTIRDETHASLQAVLTPEQFEGFRKSEDDEFRRRGPGDFNGAPRGSDDQGGGGRPGR